MPNFEVDTNGIITTPGRWQGRKLEEVMQYLEGLEEAVRNPSAAPPNEPPASPPPAGDDAAAKLAAATANRLDPLHQMTMQRLELDDEEAFARTVKDYGKYKEKIDKLKAGMHPAQRAMKNLHRTLYINVKSEDSRVMERVFRPLPEEGQTEEPVQEPASSPVVEPPAPPRSGPRPAPPMQPPTPAARSTTPPSNQRKPKLIATEKVRRFCQSVGQNVDDYLMRMEDNGMTQEDLDRAGTLGRREEPRISAYSRPRASGRS